MRTVKQERYFELMEELIRDHLIPAGIFATFTSGQDGASEISGEKGKVHEVPHLLFKNGTIKEFYSEWEGM